MVLALAKSRQNRPSNGAAACFPRDTHELLVYCPGCKTMETLWFNNGWLMPTRKFNQQGKQVFHDCGTPDPCRLYKPC